MSDRGTSLVDVQSTGKFERKASVFRNAIEEGSQFPPEGNGRYHLYVCYACPWASRTLAVRSLKGLHDHIPVHAVNPTWGVNSKEGEPESKGWVFTDTPFDGIDCSDPLYGFKSIKDLYELDTPKYSGRYTVPVLWDSKSKKIVNNESSEIIRFLNFKFNDFAKNPNVNLVPKDKEEEITKLNTQMYESINNGVYKCGFARAQEPYNEAFLELFKNLDLFDAHLGKSRFLVGSELTEADIRLFVTIIRFDLVYFGHFKCNKKENRRLSKSPWVGKRCLSISWHCRNCEFTTLQNPLLLFSSYHQSFRGCTSRPRSRLHHRPRTCYQVLNIKKSTEKQAK
eukprot:TRINITY_DN5753_c0_g1_i2.p1 TRINITY_DN5753_c0_g1~~TRINITY_DN5753_c0_g1_i2.p1  ORF type:complete len:378 (+),score=39.73 TRINITY_DN5753_c0_g1_i2:118-1134(+)